MYEPFRFLTGNAPNLESLYINAGFFDGPYWREGDSSLDTILPLRRNVTQPLPLYDLTLEGLDFGTQSYNLSNEVDFEGLHTLEIKGCSRILPFLSALAGSFSRQNPSLIQLAIYFLPDRDSMEAVQAIEDLLLSFQGLEQLYLDVSQPKLPRKESIVHHSRTLKVFGMGTTPEAIELHYDACDLRDIFQSCSGG